MTAHSRIQTDHPPLLKNRQGRGESTVASIALVRLIRVCGQATCSPFLAYRSAEAPSTVTHPRPPRSFSFSLQSQIQSLEL